MLPNMGLPTIEVQVEVGHGGRKQRLRGRGKCWWKESLGMTSMTRQHINLIVDRQKHLRGAGLANLKGSWEFCKLFHGHLLTGACFVLELDP